MCEYPLSTIIRVQRNTGKQLLRPHTIIIMLHNNRASILLCALILPEVGFQTTYTHHHTLNKIPALQPGVEPHIVQDL